METAPVETLEVTIPEILQPAPVTLVAPGPAIKLAPMAKSVAWILPLLAGAGAIISHDEEVVPGLPAFWCWPADSPRCCSTEDAAAGNLNPKPKGREARPTRRLPRPFCA